MPVVRRMVHPLLFLLARSDRTGMARQIQFLKEENRILRSKLPKRITITKKERARLVRLGLPLGPSIERLISIVSPRTFGRWVKGFREPKPRAKGRPGRPRTPDEIRELIVRLARENDWGYTRILGELRKLGVPRLSRTTVRSILREHGLEPAPQRREPTWDEFLKAHAQTLWACDFVVKRIWTLRGRVNSFVLVFLHVATRRVIVSEATTKPDAAWMRAHAARLCDEAEPLTGRAPRIVLRDRDCKFGPGFEAALRERNVEPLRLPHRAPNLNAHVERFIQSLQHECLERFVVLGDRHMSHLVSEYVVHYHHERPHQGMDNRPLLATGPPPGGSGPGGRVVCRSRLGGLLKHYERAA